MSYSTGEKAFLSELGRRVRKERLRRSWSQEELSFRSGLHRTYIGGVERGERNISALTLAKIAAALEVKLADLMPPTLRPKTGLNR